MNVRSCASFGNGLPFSVDYSIVMQQKKTFTVLEWNQRRDDRRRTADATDDWFLIYMPRSCCSRLNMAELRYRAKLLDSDET